VSAVVVQTVTRRLPGRIAVVCLALALSACVGAGKRGDSADLQEAARINTQLGVDYMRQGQFELALEKLERALEQDPNLAIAHSTAAFIYARRGETQRAERHYRRALSLDSGNPDTHNNFGVFLCGQGRGREAERYFLHAARDRRYATPEAAWTNAGICLRREDPRRAESHFREALRLNPQFSDALGQMAWLSFAAGDYLRARAFVQRYEQVAAHTAETLWVAARTERALGDGVAAGAYQRRLRAEFPEADFPDSPQTP
jgi:type IV pilus assembly protein PilF